jgi:23S rRNA pseudouridine2605 synthase
VGANKWFHVTLKEGRNREVRRLWESQDLIVSRLRRIRYASIELKRSLQAGEFDDLDIKLMRQLYEKVGLTLDEENFQSKKDYLSRKDRNKKFKYGNKSSKGFKRKR